KQFFGQTRTLNAFPSPTNSSNMITKIVEGGIYADSMPTFLLRTPHYLELIDMVHVDAKLFHPLGRIDHGRVDAQRTASYQRVGESFQPMDGRCSQDLRLEPRTNGGVANVTKSLAKANSSLIQRSRISQHPNQSWVTRVDVGEHDDRLWTKLSS